jgi:GNAT superfamily N-acetyltransferase
LSTAGIRLRAARRGDADGITALLQELGYPEGVDSATLNWAVSHPEIEIHVAADAQDHLIGMLAMSHRPQLRLRGRVATVDELIVTARWRRKGAARALIQRAVDRAKSLGAKRLELRSHATIEDAGVAAFAKACGFVETKSSTFALTPPEKPKRP